MILFINNIGVFLIHIITVVVLLKIQFIAKNGFKSRQ